jgi:hypothetical protein
VAPNRISARGRDLYIETKIEKLVKTASLDDNAESRDALNRALNSVEVYHAAKASVVDGKRRISIPLLRLQDETHAMMVYTSKSHPDLIEKSAGASWRRTLEITMSIPKADWLILTNLDGNWLAINRRQIPPILNSLPSAPSESLNDPSGQESGKTSLETLDSLISKTVRLPAEIRAESILAQLKGRELYVRLAAQPSGSGQPVMVTSKVGDIQGLVQAYTTRSRPGVTYGGMTWEAIVDMIENAPDIPGVHIINDNDDWVVLGRSDIRAAM